MELTQVEHSKLDSDYKAALQELVTVKARLEATLQTADAKGDVEKKYNDLIEKHTKLDQEHQTLLTANKNLTQVNILTTVKFRK